MTEVASSSWRDLFTPRVKAAILLGVIVAITFAVWDTVATYPVQMLVVFVHECGHAVAAVLTGGEVREMVINPNLSGHMASAGGNQLLVSSAGYLTSVMFGAFLIMSSSRRRWSRGVVLIVGGLLALLALIFARPILGFAFPFGILVGALLIFIALKGPALAVRGSLFYVAVVSSLYSLADIRMDLFTKGVCVNDATILAGATGIPAMFWAVLWAVIAVVIMFFALRFAIRRWS